ncbi:MAG: glycoside hydrolase family 15 protein [Gemmataceae bacterium]|nr:glycoside hydrolase family 15 protein [Gemmataceae bacterium]
MDRASSRGGREVPQALRIEDYALIGDCQTAALVGRNGSIDWLCFPRFDSGACFAALLGTPEHGRWLLAPSGEHCTTRRRYRDGTLVLETDFETADGAATLIDCMPPRSAEPDLVRVVVGRRGQVAMRLELVLRFDYGSIVPWVRRTERGLRAVGGPDAVVLDTLVPVRGHDLTTVAEFTVREGEEIPFVLMWHRSHLPPPPPIDAVETVRQTEDWWREWSGRCTCQGPWREAVVRSLITLKALTYAPTGGIVAAATTSLPEQLGGVRNWDYRLCWLRDATFTLLALVENGYTAEAVAWRDWLLRAAAGTPTQANILYGLRGERRLTEIELDWLPGYEGARPVRVGNAAYRQFQLDVFGEVLDAMFQARKAGVPPDDNAWRVACELAGFLESAWHQPDEGIWEVRGPRRHFTHSKVMAWVAFDRMVKAVEHNGRAGPVDRWRAARDAIRDEVCTKGYDARRNTFVQSYGADALDASLLMIPLVGFLPADDPRVAGTVEAVQRELMADGLVKRYEPDPAVDGLPPGEGAFLACTFWLADCLALLGRRDEATRLFEHLLELRNDVGLLSEEYDPKARRLVGNFPQAFSHIGLVNTALNLTRTAGPSTHRPSEE